VFYRSALAWFAAASVFGAMPALAQTSRPPARSAATAPAPARVAVTYKNGMLSVRADNAPIMEVLQEVSSQATIAFIPAQDISAQRLTVAFESAPLAEGIQRLLPDNDIFLFVGVGEKPPSKVNAVWIYLRGRGRGMAPVPPEAWASTAELSEYVGTIDDPQQRAEAYRGLIARKGPKAEEAVVKALGDVDPQVRFMALYSATSSEVPVVPEVLFQALADNSRDVRYQALEKLARGEEAQARTAAEFARNDLDPVLRQHAQEILNRLKAQSGGAQDPNGR